MKKNDIYRLIALHRRVIIGMLLWLLFFGIFVSISLIVGEYFLINLLTLVIPFVVVAIYYANAIKHPRYPAIDKIEKQYGTSEGNDYLLYFWTYRKIDGCDELPDNKRRECVLALAHIIEAKYGNEHITAVNSFIRKNAENWFLIVDLEKSKHDYLDTDYLSSVYEEMVNQWRNIELLEQSKFAIKRIQNACENYNYLKESDKDKLLKTLSIIANEKYYDALDERYIISKDDYETISFDQYNIKYDQLQFVSVEDWHKLNEYYTEFLDSIETEKKKEAEHIRLEELKKKAQEEREQKKKEAEKRERMQQIQKASQSARLLNRFNCIVVTECNGEGLNEVNSLLEAISDEKKFFLHARGFDGSNTLNRLSIFFNRMAQSSEDCSKLYLVIDEIYNFTKINGFDSELVKMLLNCNTRCQVKIFAFSKLNARVLRLGDAYSFFDFLTENELLNALQGSDKHKKKKGILEKIDRMTDGHSFEEYAALLLQQNGYTNVHVTPGSGDQGIDILAERDGVSYGIQCKCYSGDVGNKAVQEAFSGAKFYDCHVPVVMTNRFFTQAAQEAASKMNVLLWDRLVIDKLISEEQEKT